MRWRCPERADMRRRATVSPCACILLAASAPFSPRSLPAPASGAPAAPAGAGRRAATLKRAAVSPRPARLPVGDRPRRARRVRRPRRRRRPARRRSSAATASPRRGSPPSTCAAGCARAATRRSGQLVTAAGPGPARQLRATSDPCGELPGRMTVAYVFWHRPRPDVDPAGLRRCARALPCGARRRRRPAGCSRPGRCASARAPWPGGGEGWFEDWYVLARPRRARCPRAGGDRCAPSRGPHDAAAAGTGPAPPASTASWAATRSPPAASRSASWLAKPDGAGLRALPPRLSRAPPVRVRRSGSAASRSDPTPEFAVVGDRAARRPVAAS